jgi:hypothetical protein
MTDKPKVEIEFHYEHGDCDDCGSFENVDLLIKKDNQLVGKFGFGGHFGSGTFNPYNEYETICKIINCLGYDTVCVTFVKNEETDEEELQIVEDGKI